jgi:flagellar hook-associated protein 2
VQSAPTRLSDQGLSQSAQASLIESARKLQAPETWVPNHATSSHPDVLTAVSTHATPGTHAISVQSLATAQESISGPVISADEQLSINTVQIQVGTWSANPPAFTSNPIWPRSSLVVGPGDTSLNDVRDKINQSGMGVIAMVISGGSGSRLILKARDTGEDHGFKVSMEGDPSLMPVQQTWATDARATINGRSIRSSENLIEDAPSGLTLKFHQVSDTPVTVSVGLDVQGITKAINEFAYASNSVRDINQAPPFSPEAVPRAVQQALGQAGVLIGDDGQLAIDPQKLTATLESEGSPEKVQGLAQGLSSLIDQMSLDQ